MNWFTGIVVYLLIWWVAIFAVLPMGVQTEENPEKGHAPGAPKNPDLLRKALITSVIAAIIWVIVYVLIDMRIIDLYGEAEHMMQEDGL